MPVRTAVAPHRGWGPLTLHIDITSCLDPHQRPRMLYIKIAEYDKSVQMALERIQGMIDRLLNIQPFPNRVVQTIQHPRRTSLPIRPML